VTSTFRDMILKISPGWLQGDPSSNGELDYVGSRYLYSIALHADLMGDKIVEGISKRFATYVAPGDLEPDADALTLIGRDTTIPRGPNESSTSYATRNQRWIDDLKMSGSAFAILRQIQGYLTPQNTTPPPREQLGRLVHARAPTTRRALTVSPLVGGVPNWNWDNRGPVGSDVGERQHRPGVRVVALLGQSSIARDGVPFANGAHVGRRHGVGRRLDVGLDGDGRAGHVDSKHRRAPGRRLQGGALALRSTSSSPSIRRASTPTGPEWIPAA
jgi:hypothetical protein